MIVETLSVFPDMFEGYMSASVMGRARKMGALDFKAHDLRDWTHDRHRSTDDEPYGGGQGLLMTCPPVFEALDELRDAGGFDYEKLLNFSIHVDAGKNGPSCKVIPEIVGWINACGYKAVIKPESVAACSIADKYSK